MSKNLVYLIDDDEVVRQVIQRRLEILDCEVEVFTSPKNLFKAIEKTPPRLLMVDINLGDDFSGFDIIKKIRSDYKLDFPIIILSGDRDQKSIAHGLEVGADDYIVKPLFKLNFEEVVSHFLRTDNLAPHDLEEFHSLNVGESKCQLRFKMYIKEIYPGGLAVISDHLIIKGTSFYLSGPEIKKIIKTKDRVLVNVISSSIEIISAQEKYLLRVVVDDSENQSSIEIKNFINTKLEKKKKYYMKTR